MPELVLKKKIKFAQESYLGSGVQQAAVVGAWLGPVVGAECWFEAVCRLLHSGSSAGMVQTGVVLYIRRRSKSFETGRPKCRCERGLGAY